MELFKVLLLYFIKLVPIVTIYLDYSMEKKQKRKDNFLKKELTTLQKLTNYLAYLFALIGLLLPQSNNFYYLSLGICFLITVYYFWCSDKRVYISKNYIYLRGKEYFFKQIISATYENHKLEFTTKDLTIKMKYPQLSDEFIKKHLIKPMNKIIIQRDEKNRKKKK